MDRHNLYAPFLYQNRRINVIINRHKDCGFAEK